MELKVVNVAVKRLGSIGNLRVRVPLLEVLICYVTELASVL